MLSLMSTSSRQIYQHRDNIFLYTSQTPGPYFLHTVLKLSKTKNTTDWAAFIQSVRPTFTHNSESQWNLLVTI